MEQLNVFAAMAISHQANVERHAEAARARQSRHAHRANNRHRAAHRIGSALVSLGLRLQSV